MKRPRLLLSSFDTPAPRPASPRPLVPTPGRHCVGVARIGLKRMAMPTAGAIVEKNAGVAQPCDLAPWSRGLYGVFLPDRRKDARQIPFSDRRVVTA